MAYADRQKQKEYFREYYKANRSNLLAKSKADQQARRDKTNSNPLLKERDLPRRMLHGAKNRAKAKGLDFNIELEDIVIPQVCPVLNIPLVLGSTKLNDASPTLDRIIPSLGYVKGNVKVISARANRIKADASLEELKAVVEYIESMI